MKAVLLVLLMALSDGPYVSTAISIAECSPQFILPAIAKTVSELEAAGQTPVALNIQCVEMEVPDPRKTADA